MADFTIPPRGVILQDVTIDIKQPIELEDGTELKVIRQYSNDIALIEFPNGVQKWYSLVNGLMGNSGSGPKIQNKKVNVETEPDHFGFYPN